MERSTPELARDVIHEAQDVVRLQIELAKQELLELARRNGIAIGLIAGGAIFLFLALMVALPALLVQLWWNHVLGAVIWLGAYALLGIVLVLVGRWRLRLVAPPRTMRSLEETKQWAERLIRSNDS